MKEWPQFKTTKKYDEQHPGKYMTNGCCKLCSARQLDSQEGVITVGDCWFENKNVSSSRCWSSCWSVSYIMTVYFI